MRRDRRCLHRLDRAVPRDACPPCSSRCPGPGLRPAHHVPPYLDRPRSTRPAVPHAAARQALTRQADTGDARPNRRRPSSPKHSAGGPVRGRPRKHRRCAPTVPGHRRRPLCVRAHRLGPRTGAEKATDGAGRSGYADRPPGFLPLTWHFRMPARCRHLPRHQARTRAGCHGRRGRP